MDTIDDTWTAFNPPATALNSKAIHQDILTIRNLACFKLVCSTEFSSKLSMIEALSVLSSRRYLFTISPSELILVDVAAELMFQPGHLVKFIDRLFDATRCGVVDGSYRDELVARLLLLLAADVASMNKNKSVEDEECSKFLSGTIFFTHFIPMFYSPRRQYLLYTMTYSAAIICKRNNARVDLSTGIQDKYLRKLAEGSYKLNPSFISFILVQVKNYQDSYDSYTKIA
ncbi:1990_t:CDS:2 [Funneliformis caledonium]|uniref:1990_t:CDS:1 n=1 Tax=Funneliformis caledonium TaxID=1117310 RepID=A0A9N8ZTW3_9GLOM|nr:1990_t:CDS:2 [Funneliformis caledonium]